MKTSLQFPLKADCADGDYFGIFDNLGEPIAYLVEPDPARSKAGFLPPIVQGLEAEAYEEHRERAELLVRCANRYQELVDILGVIVANAKMVPDMTMNGTTDTYVVPIDDIEKAQDVLGTAMGRTFSVRHWSINGGYSTIFHQDDEYHTEKRCKSEEEANTVGRRWVRTGKLMS